jgi:hypothetical protein
MWTATAAFYQSDRVHLTEIGASAAAACFVRLLRDNQDSRLELLRRVFDQ